MFSACSRWFYSSLLSHPFNHIFFCFLFSFYCNSQHSVTLISYYSYPLSYRQTSVQCSKSLSLVSEHLESHIAPPIQELSRRIRYRVDVLRDTYTAQLELLEGSPGSLPHHTHPIFHLLQLQCSALYCTALHSTALLCTALYCTALHCTALHCSVLHCTTLHCYTFNWAYQSWYSWYL